MTDQGDKRRLFIVSAGSFGRVLECWLDMVPENERDWELAGYLHSSNGPSPLIGYPTDHTIVGDWREFDFRDSDLCLMGTANIVWKHKIYEGLKDKVEFMTYVHPTALINHRFVKLGAGSVICANCAVNTNTETGVCATICMGSQLGHDISLGNYSSLMASIEIGGHCKIGEDVFIGTSATIIPRRNICSGAVIGAGAVVVKNINDTQTRFGNPAKPLNIRELSRLK